MMKKLVHGFAALVAAFAFAACGGGGDDGDGGADPGGGTGGGGTGGGTTGTVAIAANQDSANTLVKSVNDGVAAIREANAAGALPGGARIFALPAGATSTQTLQCSQLGTSGSGSLTVTTTIEDGTNRPLSAAFTYDACTFTFEGGSYSLNGSGSLTYTNWVDASNFTFTFTYNISYSVVSGAYSESGTLNSTQTCTIAGNQAQCSYTIGDSQVSNVTVVSNGSVTTVTDAQIVRGSLTYDYNNWTYDSSVGRATSGSVVITDTNGNRAEITASSTGYTVIVTVNGTTTTYTVTIS